MTTVQPEKHVSILSRTEFMNRDCIVFSVLSSDRKRKYETTLVHGKCVKCTCPSRLACYHGIQLEQLEADRREAEAERDRILAEYALMQAEKELEAKAAATDDSTTGENDPWFGYTAQQRFDAWRQFEMSMAGLAD